MNDTPLDRLRRAMKATAGSRFNAAKRLQQVDVWLTTIIACASATLIILTILPYLMRLPVEVSDNLNLWSVALSIAVLVASLLQYSKNNAVNAEQHHRCALETKEILRELDLQADTISLEQLDVFRRRYDVVLQKFSLNHDDVDWQEYQLQRPEDYPHLGRTQRLLMYLRVKRSKLLMFIAAVAAIVFFAWLIFFYVVPARMPKLAVSVSYVAPMAQQTARGLS